MVDRNENSADVSKTKDGRSFSAEITHRKIKNITDNQKFRKKRSKTYAESLQSIGTSTLMGKFINH